VIYLHSGDIGSGKTLSAVERGMAWVKEGRRVFELGVNECNHEATGIQPFPTTLDRWFEPLQPGDVLIVDEIQDHLPKGFTARSVPEWVKLFAKSRHRGVDLLWITQDPRNMDSFPRRLVNEHRHYVNKWGGEEAKVFVWPSGVEEPDSSTEKKRDDKFDWKYPKELYGLYKSAEAHTRKKYTPRQVKLLRWSLAAAAVCVLVAVLVVKFKFMSASAAHDAKPSLLAVSPASMFEQPESKGRHVLSKAEWVARMVPRVDGLLWTAPLFDDRKPVSEPETYCMAMEPDRCACISEQGTKIKMQYDACMSIVRNGVYNPYRKPRQERQPFEARREPNSSAVVVQAPVVEKEPVAAPLKKHAGARSLYDAYDPSVFRASAD